ncbi:lipocalin family protein [Alteromonas sp. ASW11-36]|uniref:Outer membrane lipoprotein Blc n=1 Tax=Alteromonas arenosi TaxID=3055817 RepID=A0ABT7STY2_9ALTE|nr:lipocalin family protein [Alteromonas sp. ASW11-36]MDM7859007.1 lipocalin family protein [Alteromonas sp. ASW11-36]
MIARKVTIKLRYLGIAFAAMVLQGCTSVPEGLDPVTNFDVQKYLGTWYEIARFDHSFERGLNNVTATYALREDGGIAVLNRGYNTAEQEWEQAEGKAYFVNEPTTGHLKVSFFGPFYASYVVIALDDEDYQYSLVTGPDRDYLWILARQPNVPQQTLDALLDFAQQSGYDTEKFIWVEHTQER